MADDLGYSDLGCYGGEIETPNLDRLAQGGLRFSRFYNTARCWPSRGALLSGHYAQQIRRDTIPGMGGGATGKRPSWVRMLPAILKSGGYRCYHSGKWHIDGKVLAAGFDRSLDMRNQGNFFSSRGNSIDDIVVPAPAKETGYYATQATVDHAIRCLEEHRTQHANAPFFHYVAFIAPHFPLHAEPQDIAKYAYKYRDGWDAMRTKRHQRQKELGLADTELSPLEREVGPPYAFPEAMKKLGDNEVNRPVPWEELTGEQQMFQSTKMAIHAAMVDRMDREIGRLLDQIQAMGESENTMILFCSDNGASAEIMVRDGGHDPAAPMGSEASYLCLGPGFSSACNTPHRRHKTWVHEGGISTPLVVHWPRGIAARGEWRQTPSHLIDIVPTLLDITQIEDRAEADEKWSGFEIPKRRGKSLVPALTSDVRIERDYLWWLHEGNRAIQSGDWKLVAVKGGPWELYDMRHDRAEQNDQASQHPEIVEKLSALWQQELDLQSEVVKESNRREK